MKKDIISVVVPVYNVEKYIIECVNSIIKQTYSNIEILLIDDGSTDSSGIICDNFKIKDERIKVFHKANEGLGYTRNFGIEHANGKYIVFIDSDDFISENFIELLYNSIKLNDVEIAYCGHNKYYDKNYIYKELSYYKNECIENKDIFEKVIIEMIGSMKNVKEDKRVSMSACEAMYSLDLIKNKHIRFKSEREYISEDLIFQIEILNLVNKVYFLDDNIYFYRVNNNQSLTHKFDTDIINKNAFMCKKIIEQFEEKNISIEEKKKLEYSINRFMLSRLRTEIIKAITYYTKIKNNNELKNIIKQYINHTYIKNILKRYPLIIKNKQQTIFNFFIRVKAYTIIILLVKLKNRKRNKNRF